MEINDGDFPRTYLDEEGGECLAAGLDGPTCGWQRTGTWARSTVLLTVGWRRTAEQCLVCRAHQLLDHWPLAHAARTYVQRTQTTEAAAASCGCRQSQRTRAGGYALGRDVRCVVWFGRVGVCCVAGRREVVARKSASSGRAAGETRGSAYARLQRLVLVLVAGIQQGATACLKVARALCSPATAVFLTPPAPGQTAKWAGVRAGRKWGRRSSARSLG